MKIYKNLEEVLKDVKNDVLELNCDVKFEFHLKAEFSLKIIGDISARDISAWDISARDISAWDISAWDISARDISAWDISAWDISFYAVCFAYVKFICKSIKGKRKNSKYFCLDSKVVINGGEKKNDKKNQK